MNEGTEFFDIGESGLSSRPRIGTTWAGVADVVQSMSRIVKSVNQEQCARVHLTLSLQALVVVPALHLALDVCPTRKEEICALQHRFTVHGSPQWLQRRSIEL